MLIPDEQKAAFYLSQLNYYRFAAYCLPFEQDHASHQFQAGTGFEDVFNLYVFDRELRLLVLDAIERFEVSLRTQLAYHLSHNHTTAHPHLKPQIFHNPVIYGACLNKLDNDINRSREEFIKHLTQKYEELQPPIWAVVELMTMGQLSKWFSNIEARADRQAISRIYGLDEKVMTSFCEHLSLVRNHAAHHARLWNRDFTKTPMLPRRGDQKLINSLFNLPDTDRRLRKLYNTFVLLAYLMNTICGENHWAMRLKELIDSHHVDPVKMGFPTDWQQKDIWN
ncbi:Abi family protein [Nitrincola tapanii]|uniref:Abi family protein n=1 Tax=Nitrincola tapanii TaxID=1708751 RepID=A0A5A9W470_9GAMM|nr:Abi family protein [Nitrincola tapanii]KAA0875009.1 Abi family protein [Nitrincola tapanii]